MATNNGYSRTLVPRIGYTRSVRFRNRVRRSFGQPGAVLGVFLYLILAVPGNGYLTTGYTHSWLFPFLFRCFLRYERKMKNEQLFLHEKTKNATGACLNYRRPKCGEDPRFDATSTSFHFSKRVTWRTRQVLV